jgi:hypothetical protein
MISDFHVPAHYGQLLVMPFGPSDHTFRTELS